LAGERFLLCPERNRHQPAPLLAYTLSWRNPDRGRRIAVVRHERFSECDDAGPRSPNTRERKMDTTTLLVIVLVVLLLGGGGFFYRRRV
jgi:LPXTG-motif cell wall-anchored protein